ncbi:hypothetical protein [Longimicrobium terrae]|uniref:Uncharacterized protein n=1 Tax=Longimicrobium terrae TaxID=1639882 RepID=A0A841GVA1_9BACT|nr:hypothetical protein [Longimicrobium terrae]MBB4635174.1 hypothetical protein [Longimicrobium terrae]MBB6069568.1 hypothetical protein [Longimicrobium terrae]NNC31629.1 hypothetical protein [Longimicrobium terrae]
MRIKVSRIVFAAIAVVSIGAGARAASAQEENEVKTPKEFALMVNPLTGHVYCVAAGSGCFVVS